MGRSCGFKVGREESVVVRLGEKKLWFCKVVGEEAVVIRLGEKKKLWL